MVKGEADRHPLLCVCSVFVGLILRDGVQIRLYSFGFLGPLGLDSGRFTTPFLKCVSSNFSKKTNNPNPSPIKKIWFGLYLFGARGGSRTRTPLRALAPEASESTNSTTRASGCTHQREIHITMDSPFCQHFFTDLYTAFSLDKIGKGHYNKQAVT